MHNTVCVFDYVIAYGLVIIRHQVFISKCFVIYVQSSHSVVVFELVKRDLLFSKSPRQALAGRAVYQQYRYITTSIPTNSGGGRGQGTEGICRLSRSKRAEGSNHFVFVLHMR